MKLSEIVERYRELAAEFGAPVPLAAFGWSRAETERIFSALDEDYQISRFLSFRNFTQSATGSYLINGFPQTHLAITAEIREIL
jgi:hypothetical protein